jgi:type II secretory pathway component PulF
MNVASEALVTRDLQSRGLYPVDIKESRPRSSVLSRFTARKKLKHDQRILFLRQFEAMLRAGIPITTSLVAIADQSENPTFKEILTEIRKDIEGGSTLAQATRKHPALLTNIQVSLIEAGEQGGILDEILERLCQLIEYDEETKARVRSATFYPGIVIAELGLAFVVIVRFVFPRFKALFSSRGADLPLPTKIMIAVSDFTTDYWWHIVAGAVVIAVGLYRYAKTEGGKKRIDALALKVPIFGEIMLMILMSRFARVLSSLLESGIPFLRSLSIVERTIDNKPIQDEISYMGRGIQKGRSIAESIREGGCFPSPVVKMLEVGERAGKISEMLMRVSGFYDRQVDYRIKNLTTILEPILLVVLGAGVLFIALAVFLPMWDMTRVVMGG